MFLNRYKGRITSEQLNLRGFPVFCNSLFIFLGIIDQNFPGRHCIYSLITRFIPETSAFHRIDPQVVRDTFAKSCFSLNAEAEFLRNGDDDHTLAVFDKTIRGNTDRFVFRFVRD